MLRKLAFAPTIDQTDVLSAGNRWKFWLALRVISISITNPQILKLHSGYKILTLWEALRNWHYALTDPALTPNCRNPTFLFRFTLGHKCFEYNCGQNFLHYSPNHLLPHLFLSLQEHIVHGKIQSLQLHAWWNSYHTVVTQSEACKRLKFSGANLEWK